MVTQHISTELHEGPDPRLVIDEATIRVKRGPDRGAELALAGDSLLIGSGRDCALVLHDNTVSARHAEIQATTRGYFIRDLSSTNGVRLQGFPIERAPLCGGMELALGESVIAVSSLASKRTFPMASPGELDRLVARSVKMRVFVASLLDAARSDATVLLEGETGTGKEVAAEALHAASPRARRPFITFDCAAVSPSLAGAELFGHEKGAFTGADIARPGVMEDADGGTLFLDEIGDLPLDLQPLLLRLLERKQARRIGSHTDRTYDVRIVAATNRNLAEEVRAKRFRQDLFYRLAVVRLRLPPLRERPEDVPVLADVFAREVRGELAPETIAPLLAYGWPGNVRELRNTVTRMIVQPGAIGDLVPARPARTRVVDDAGQLIPLTELRQVVINELEREYVVEALARAHGSLTRAAELAGVTRQYLTTLAQKHGLHPRAR